MARAKRPGRPWAPARGHCAEINDLVELVRSWLDQSGLTVNLLHVRLTAEHFVTGSVPEVRKLRCLLAGEGLTWDLVEAVADVCFPDEAGPSAAGRLKPAHALWEAASMTPTVLGADGEPAVSARDLLQAQQRALTAWEELNRVRQAYEASEQARHSALQVATVLFAVLGQSQAQVAQLARRLDALRSAADPALPEITSTLQRLGRAQAQEEDLQVQLARAQSEREKAQGLADVAARRVQTLEAELHELRGTSVQKFHPHADAPLQLPAPVNSSHDEDLALDQVDAALQRARDVLDREHEAVEEIADELRQPTTGLERARITVIPGEASSSDQPGASNSRDGRDGRAGFADWMEELSGTTPDNPVTSAIEMEQALAIGREAYIAGELQRAMLPDSLPQPTGVRLASRYLPAAETARAGGDWYDAIPLPGNRVALIIGDVMGHSITSAAIMGQLRATTQSMAGLDLPPQEVLHHLDEQAQRLGTGQVATCLYAVYDPVSHRITIANAGHPPPILLHLGGRAQVLRVPPGAPIGVGGVDFEAVELDAPAGATLLLYTDGLVESRLRDAWTGIEQLRERLADTAQLTGPDHSPPLEALCDDVLDMLGPGDRDDDIALLAARFNGIPPSDVAYWFLEPEDAAPGRARRLARRALTRWGLEELSDSVELLVSEVVTNAVRYAERPVTLRLLRTDVLRCEVGDDSGQLPRHRRPADDEQAGRGLLVVNHLARRWGATRLSTGKVVWFELALPDGGPPPPANPTQLNERRSPGRKVTPSRRRPGLG